MTPFLGELVGTAILIAFGTGVVANVLLQESKGQNSGWIVITFGWAIAVFAGVYMAAPSSGAHLNPAVTIALALLQKFSWSLVPQYILAQFLGAFIGATLTWLMYYKHFQATTNPALKLAVFCNDAAIKSPHHNFLTETIATAIFVLAVLFIAAPANSLGALDALPVALLVLGVGLCFGGPTGYAINPARDLGPRIMHALLPIPGKAGSNWQYSWIPVAGPITGGILAAFIFQYLQ